MHRVRSSFRLLLRVVGMGVIGSFWLLWVALLGLWFLETPLGMPLLVWGGWVPAEAQPLATYTNSVLQIWMVWTLWMGGLHLLLGLWPFTRGQVQARRPFRWLYRWE